MKIQFFTLLLAIAIYLSGCASILNPLHQKIRIQTGDSNAQVYLNGKIVAKGSEVPVKLNRSDFHFQSITIKREGYLDENYIVGKMHVSPLIILSLIPFGVFIIPPAWDMNMPRAFDYSRKINLKSNKLIKTPKRQSNQKYLYLASTGFDVTTIGGQRQSYKQFIKNKKGTPHETPIKTEKQTKTGAVEKDVDIQNSIFTEKLNDILKNVGFMDTTNTFLKSFVNTIYIKGTVRAFDLNKVNHTQHYNAMYIGLKVEWEIQDFYNQPQFTKTYTTESGAYPEENRECLEKSVTDALLRSFYALLAEKEVQKLLEMNENLKDTKEKKLVLTKPATPIENLQDAIKATATVVVDKGHGSGFFVSPDGYMITNYHVVAGSKKITVKTNDGKSYEARVVQKNEFSDLALIKIDQKVEYAFTLPEKAVFSIGEECFAIGTPKSVELGQTLTKGIISATRDKAGQKIIQTDVSINSGNSGGALVSPKGNLIGIVSAKLMGVGVEGIAFGVLADDVLKYLNITY